MLLSVCSLLLSTETAGRCHGRTVRPGFQGKAVFREGHGLGGQPGCDVSVMMLGRSMPCRVVFLMYRCTRLGSAGPATTDGLPRRCGRHACVICRVSGALRCRRGRIRCGLRRRGGCRRRHCCDHASSMAAGRTLAAISRRSTLPMGGYEVTASRKASDRPRRRRHLVHRERQGASRRRRIITKMATPDGGERGRLMCVEDGTGSQNGTYVVRVFLPA